MNRLSVIIWCLLASLHGVAQQYHAECISLSSFYPTGDAILKTTSDEMYLFGYGTIIKTNKYGEPIGQFKVTVDESITDSKVDNSDNLCLLSYNFQTGENRQLRKLKINGSDVWPAKPISWYAYQIAVDPSGNIYLLGYDYTDNVSSTRLAKYNAAGTLLWDKLYDRQLISEKIVANNLGEIFILSGTSGAYSHELIKLDANGNETWINYYSGGDNYSTSWLYLDGGGNPIAIIPGGGVTLAKVNRATGAEVTLNLGVSSLAPRYTGTDLYAFGPIPDGFRIFKVSLTSMTITQDFDWIVEESYFTTPRGIIANQAGDIYVNGETFDQFTQKTYMFVQKFVNEQPSWKYSPKSPGNGIELDFDGNVLATVPSCLTKITECDNVAPQLTMQPSNKEVCPGQDASFEVKATGHRLYYYWYKGTDHLSNSTKYAGATTGTLTIKNVTAGDAGTYHCQITDGCGGTLTTQNVNLTVTALPIITAQATNSEVCPGATTTLQITTTGGKNVKYQWKKGGQALTESSVLTGTKTNSLTLKSITAGDAGEYTCEISAECMASSLVSQKAVLSVSSATEITRNPTGLTSCTGKTVELSISAAGSNLSYQWKKGTTNLTESTRITGTTKATLRLGVLQLSDAGEYTCTVTGACGVPITSTKAVLTVVSDGTITSQPQPKSVCSGLDVSFSISATGDGITYQWMKGNTALSNNTKYTGVTTATLGVKTVSSAEVGAYTCVITTACLTKVSSNAAQLTVATPASIASKSADLNTCSGEPATFVITVNGNVSSYQWKRNNISLNDDASVVGSRTAQLLLNSVSAAEAGNYTCEITPACGQKQSSGVIKLAIKEDVSITKQPIEQPFCEGEKIVLNLEAKGAGITYQWKKNGVDITNNSITSGATTAKLTILNGSVANDGYYTCEVTGCGGKVRSDVINLRVNPTPQLELVTRSDCNPNNLDWSTIVADLRGTNGEFLLLADGSNEPIDIFSITKTGAYTIIKESSGCRDSIPWNNQCIITAVEENGSLDWSVTPNPTSSWFRIKSAEKKAIEFNIINSNGLSVLSGTIQPSGEISIDGAKWSSGVYAVLFRLPNGRVSMKRLLIER